MIQHSSTVILNLVHIKIFQVVGFTVFKVLGHTIHLIATVNFTLYNKVVTLTWYNNL